MLQEVNLLFTETTAQKKSTAVLKYSRAIESFGIFGENCILLIISTETSTFWKFYELPNKF